MLMSHKCQTLSRILRTDVADAEVTIWLPVQAKDFHVHCAMCPICCDHAFWSEQQREQVQKMDTCFSCFGHNHSVAVCLSINRYQLCRERHHTLLHIAVTEFAVPQSDLETNGLYRRNNQAKDTTQVVPLTSLTCDTVLLTITIISLISASSCSISVRAFLDLWSKVSFISERIAQ